MESAMPTVVLVHGAWHGPWGWDEVRRYLDLAQITSAAIALPRVGEDTGKLGGLADDCPVPGKLRHRQRVSGSSLSCVAKYR